jgi:NADPH:quinone reductase
MRAIVYTQAGDPDVLRLVERATPEPQAGEVRVRVHVSGVNPTDWKSRRGGMGPIEAEQVPNQDGAGVIDAVGDGVDLKRVGQRVWLWAAARTRGGGTAQEWVVVPERHAVPLPDDASFELGASLPIPAITAHRCLTVAEAGPSRLGPDALSGRTVLVAGGAGAVGNAAIQLARWSGATVITTVSSETKARLAEAAGAHHTVNYRDQDAAAAVRVAAPDGVDVVVEVAPAVNATLDAAVLAPNGTVAVYANDGGNDAVLSVRTFMVPNVRWQFVLLYTLPGRVLTDAIADVSDAVAVGAYRVGEDAGLPLHHFPLDQVAAAHQAVEDHAVGKVLIDLV